MQQMRTSSHLTLRPHQSAAPALAGPTALGSPSAMGMLQVEKGGSIASAQTSVPASRVAIGLLVLAARWQQACYSVPQVRLRDCMGKDHVFAPARLSRTAHLPPCAQPCGTSSKRGPAGPASSEHLCPPADTNQQPFGSMPATLACFGLTASRQAPPLTGMLRPAPHTQLSHNRRQHQCAGRCWQRWRPDSGRQLC